MPGVFGIPQPGDHGLCRAHLPRHPSSHQQGLGVLLRDHQKFERGLPRAARALLPTPHGIGANVQVAGEERLAGVERLPDEPDLFRGDRLGPRWDARDAQIHGLAALVGQGILHGFAHVIENVYFDFLRHVQAPIGYHNVIVPQ